MEVNRRKQSWPGRKAGAGGWKGRPLKEAKRSRDPENEDGAERTWTVQSWSYGDCAGRSLKKKRSGDFCERGERWRMKRRKRDGWLGGEDREGDKLRCCSGDLTEGEEEWERQTLLCVVAIITENRTIGGRLSKMLWNHSQIEFDSLELQHSAINQLILLASTIEATAAAYQPFFTDITGRLYIKDEHTHSDINVWFVYYGAEGVCLFVCWTASLSATKHWTTQNGTYLSLWGAALLIMTLSHILNRWE